MKKKGLLFTLLVIFLSCVSSGQKNGVPLMFGFSDSRFLLLQTDFCRKYKCDLIYVELPNGMPLPFKDNSHVDQYDPENYTVSRWSRGKVQKVKVDLRGDKIWITEEYKLASPCFLTRSEC